MRNLSKMHKFAENELDEYVYMCYYILVTRGKGASMKKTTKICKYCKTEIPADAKVCPQCRRNQGGHGCLIVIGAIVAIGVAATAISGGGSSEKKANTETETTVVAETEAMTESELSSDASSEETTIGETTIAETEARTVASGVSAVMGLWDDSGEDIDVPTEYRSALRKAESYSEMMHMSKNRLYDQLTSEYGEKFSAEAAQYAIDNIDADWDENALENAQNYSDTMHMSKARLYDQLTSEYGEKFTAEEAQYAVDNVTADWNENALATAKNYQTTMSMSPEAIRSQLTSDYGEKFTAEEAEYAIAHLD